MSKEKTYYWLKLKENFFEEDTIQFIEEQENGILYSNFYMKLCLKSLRNDGALVRIVGETLIPYDYKSLSRLTGVHIDTVMVAMQLFENIGLVKRLETGEIYLNQIKEMVGKETKDAERMRKLRAKKNKCLSLQTEQCANNVHLKTNNVQKCSPNVQKCSTEIEKEKELEKELEKEYFCSELQVAQEHDNTIMEFPTNRFNTSQETFAISEKYIAELTEVYPNVNIMAELKRIGLWLKDNPAKRKTLKGMRRFISAWLDKAQNQYKGNRQGYSQDKPKATTVYQQRMQENEDIAKYLLAEKYNLQGRNHETSNLQNIIDV